MPMDSKPQWKEESVVSTGWAKIYLVPSPPQEPKKKDVNPAILPDFKRKKHKRTKLQNGET